MQFNQDQKQTLNEAFEKYGYVDQKDQFVEEMAELIFAFNKFKRKPTEERKEGLMEEMADVTIMLEQWTDYFGKENIQKHIDFKLNRLKERLNKVVEQPQ